MTKQELQDFLEGKRLLLEEIPIPADVLQQYELCLKYEQGVIVKGTDYSCIRCGNQDVFLFAQAPCVRCNSSCTYCRNCIMMGKVSECTTLVHWTGATRIKVPAAPSLNWNGTLSEGQQQASSAVIQAVKKKETCLIWAVCGAGKTEVLFAGIDAALQKGERVCIATPRTDVVLELHPRLQQVFPAVSVAALYGGSADRGKQAALTISTAHQLLRYYHAFDTLIIDEVDAFPYSVNLGLQYAAEQAKAETAAVIYLTATPDEQWKREVQAGKRNAVIVPARYHGNPLPVPSFVWCGNWQRKMKNCSLPAVVLHWLQAHLRASRPIFLFVPRISCINPVVAYLKQVDERIEGVHAEDRQRKEKVGLFRKGQIPLLVTTTILERGVTVPNLQVGVVGAEEPIFTESALVQIAGRVGRNAAFPTGDIVYFHYGKTDAMVAARRHIRRMNILARKKGWI